MVYNTLMQERIKAYIVKKRFIIAAIFGTMFIVFVAYIFRTVTITPQIEETNMQRLELTMQQYQLAPFTTDGCSAGISDSWNTAVAQFSQLSDTFATNYADLENIPFESACIEHDRLYHSGIGGYAGRLVADNQLRNDILSYGIANVSTVQAATGLETAAQAMSLFDLVAEVVYRGVRAGGSPCTEETYAWGYGYNRGACVSLPE